MLLALSVLAYAAPVDGDALESVRAHEMVEADLASYALLRTHDPAIHAFADAVVDDDLALVRALHERVREANLPRFDTRAAATIRANGEALLANLRLQPDSRFDQAFLASILGVEDAAIADLDTLQQLPVTADTQTFLLNVSTSFDAHRQDVWALMGHRIDAGAVALR